MDTRITGKARVCENCFKDLEGNVEIIAKTEWADNNRYLHRARERSRQHMGVHVQGCAGRVLVHDARELCVHDAMELRSIPNPSLRVVPSAYLGTCPGPAIRAPKTPCHRPLPKTLPLTRDLNLNPKRNQKLNLNTGPRRSTQCCMACHSEFTMMLRRHHCRSCGEERPFTPQS